MSHDEFLTHGGRDDHEDPENDIAINDDKDRKGE